MPLILHSAPAKRAKMPAGGAGDWQLAAGHWVPAKFSPVIVGPSADTEAETDAAWSRYRRCPSAIAYRIPVAVLGGAYPFYYELTTAPTGMTIGAQLGDTDYGIINWATPTVGDHSVAIQVTDQDGATATRSWTLEVIDRENTTYFLFCDSAAGSDSTGDGSYSDPYQTFLGWYGETPGATTGRLTTTYPGRQVFYRAGTYYTDVITDPDGYKFWLNPTRKPQVHVAYPGETVTFDATDLYFGGMTADFCVSGIDHINGVCAEGGTRMTYYRNDNGPGRNLFFENEFGAATGTPAGGSNSGSIMFDGDASYAVVSHNTFAHTADTHILVYQTKYSVFQHNVCTPPGTNGNGVFLKSSGYDHWSIRANTGYGAGRFLTFQDGIQSEPDHDISHIEICWNSYRGVGTVPVRWAESSGCSGGYIWTYRNSFSGSGAILHDTFNAALSTPVNAYEKNVLQGLTLAADAGSTPSIYDTSNDSTDQTNVTGWLNATTNLLEGDGLAYRGTHGAEVA